MAGESILIGRAFVDLCLLRRAPQDIPASTVLLYLTLILYTLVNLLAGLLNPQARNPVVIALFATAMLVAFAVFVLRLRGFPERLPQTLTALAGAGVVLSIPAIPLDAWLVALHTAGQRSAVGEALWILLFVWSLFVAAHILRHALQTRLFFAFLIASAYTWFMWSAISVIYALSDPAPQSAVALV